MDYIKEAIKTESHEREIVNHRVLHGAIGVCTESGELLDAVKKAIFYKADLDHVNIKEEIGDIFWYLAILCDHFGWSFEEIQELNIRKLKARYPDKFNTIDASSRDLSTERAILDGEATC